MRTARYLLASLLLFGSAAHAVDGGGLFLEPGVTYQFISSADFTLPSPVGSGTGDVKGPGLMGRIGFHLLETLFVAGDIRYGWQTVTDNGAGYNSTGSALNWGLTGGLQTPVVGLRAWVGWILGGLVDPGQSSGVDVKWSGGSGWRVGAGWKITAVSLNLEYQQISYDSLDLQQLGTFPAGTNVGGSKLSDKAWVLSLSFPIEM